VFGPLAATGKAEVTKLSIELIPIRKNNFIKHYSRAREKAFTKGTILSAWKKTGIMPFNRNAIPQEAFEPALNTTTKAAQPIPTEIPEFLTPITSSNLPSDCPSSTPAHCEATSSSSSTVQSDSDSGVTHLEPSSISPSVSSTTSATSNKSIEDLSDEAYFARMTAHQMFEFLELPPRCLSHASRKELQDENLKLRNLLDKTCFQMQRDYALKKLMDRENERLRQQLFNKKKIRKKVHNTAWTTSHLGGELASPSRGRTIN
jgi:hypothetical protein